MYRRGERALPLDAPVQRRGGGAWNSDRDTNVAAKVGVIIHVRKFLHASFQTPQTCVDEGSRWLLFGKEPFPALIALELYAVGGKTSIVT